MATPEPLPLSPHSDEYLAVHYLLQSALRPRFDGAGVAVRDLVVWVVGSPNTAIVFDKVCGGGVVAPAGTPGDRGGAADAALASLDNDPSRTIDAWVDTDSLDTHFNSVGAVHRRGFHVGGEGMAREGGDRGSGDDRTFHQLVFPM